MVIGFMLIPLVALLLSPIPDELILLPCTASLAG
jgi:hypothetical protein